MLVFEFLFRVNVRIIAQAGAISARFCSLTLLALAGLVSDFAAAQTVVEFNNAGGTTATNGLHFYIDSTSKIQVRRLNNTGQVYSPTVIPPNNALDNGVFIRANNLLYGPSHTVTTFNPTGGMYNTSSITAVSPANPTTAGVLQTATNNLGITAGPQVSIVWKYTTPNDFLTAEVTLVIPALYPVSAANPVRYYHVFDTFLGGSDSGCGLNVSGPKRIVGTYSAPCGSSTTLPASGIVESFRERNGTFSAFCAAGWSTFFTNGNPNCSVLQANPMSNTITTTLQDTGIGIEFDFTASGTYTFSYDFVVGTTAVPDYDHIEIRHDGSATLCPENIVVLACTSSTVPCPPLSVVNTGTLTGSVSFSPVATGVTFTPTSFALGTAASSVNMVLQATAASAGTYTMLGSGLSKAPLNGTKCTNLAGTASASCSITIANTPCVTNFECMETAATYFNPVTATNRNPLYTKLAATGFKFDVLALQASGAIATAFTGNVNVELYDDTAGTCLAAPTLAGTTQVLSFAAVDSGRKTILTDIVLAAANKKLRCRVKQTGVSSPVTACSSDTFTVRPRAISTITSNATADNDPSGSSYAGPPGSTVPAILKAGSDNFTLTASTGVVGYNGTPKVNNSLLEWTSVPTANGGLPVPGTGTVSGEFAVANAATGNTIGTTFTYSEVGYFRFKALGVYDDDFVTNAGSGDVANGDCTNDASNNLVGGKYGCKFGNSAVSAHFGRFIPDHFQISIPKLTEACSLGLPGVTPFSYFGQDGFQTLFAITAQNSSGGTTKNYTGDFAKLNLANYSSYQFTISSAPAGSTVGTGALAPTGSWFAGETATSNVTPSAPARVTVWNKITRPTALSNETIIGVYVAPTDGEVPAAVTPTLVGSSRQRYGRMRLQNGYGSEMLDLPVPFYAEHRIGNLWVKNVDDSCTLVAAPTAATGLGFFPEAGVNHLSASETTATVSATGKLAAGDSKLKFSKPGLGNSGYFDLALPVPLWLQFPWRGGVTQMNPEAKVKFGAYKKANEFIYLREVH